MSAPSGFLDSLAGELSQTFAALSAPERLAGLVHALAGTRIVFTTSFGLEDQALAALIAQAGLPVELVTLDTGRMFPETYQVWRETEAFTGLRIKSFYPEREGLEELVGRQGIDGFYESVAQRHACCEVRKVKPLARALAGASGWITGLRASQSQARTDIDFVSFDPTRGLLKANPIADWSREQLVDFTAKSGLPVHALHAQGFPSIGCAPCTRAIAPGEDERAGRWWWETSSKECGLHVGADGRLARTQSGKSL